MNDKTILEMTGIEKSYSGNCVLKGVSLSIKEGEIFAIVGENGAGKSTLMNILFGMDVIHSTGGFKGKICFDGQEVNISSPQRAMELGIGMVHQEFMLIPEFTITENIKLNREITKPNLISRMFGKKLNSLDMAKMRQDAREAIDKIGVSLDELTTVDKLPVGHMQFVEIARELDKRNIKLLVFDEPTAVLTETESEHFLKLIRQIAARGIACILISHKLEEIIDTCDEIMVMRDGERVALIDNRREKASVYALSEMMIGHTIAGARNTEGRDFSTAETLMSIRNLAVDMPGETVKGIDIDIRKGEILGFAGLAGHGKLGIANGIMGLYPARGNVTFRGEAVKLGDTMGMLKRRVVFLSEDRKGVGLLLKDSIEDNITTTATVVKGEFLKKAGPISQMDKKAVREHAQRMIEALKIKCTGPRQLAGALSGGNQQKVCIASAITMAPELLFVSEPTRGIDVGAKALVLERLLRMNREEGVTIVMTSSELSELCQLCDRIAIVAEGKILGILPPTAEPAMFGMLMSGERIHSREGRSDA